MQSFICTIVFYDKDLSDLKGQPAILLSPYHVEIITHFSGVNVYYGDEGIQQNNNTLKPQTWKKTINASLTDITDIRIFINYGWRCARV